MIKLLLSLLLLVLCSNIFGQINGDKKNISVNAKTLEESLKIIEETYGVQFSYSKEKIPTDTLVTIRLSNASLENVLDYLHKNYRLKYLVVENTIVLKKDNTPIAVEEKPEKPKTYSISGNIQDNESGEALIGATVWVEGDLIRGTTTNNYGYFSLSLPEGEYILNTSYVGYDVQRKSISLHADMHYSASLQFKLLDLEEITINASEEDNFNNAAQINSFVANIQQASKTPEAMGEPDVLKSLYQIPGIKFYRDGSVYFHVRGGARDQNLILIDDAPLFSSSHLFGLYSNIFPESVKEMKTYKGNFPVQYGGRLSGIVDIRTKDGNLYKTKVNGGIGFITSRISVEGPMKKEKSSYFISLRKSNINWLAKRATNDSATAKFFDFSAKFNLKINRKNRVYLAFYAGGDEFINNAGFKWTNSLLSLRWNFIPVEKFFVNTTAYLSGFDYKFLVDVEKNNFWQSQISTVGLKSDATWYVSPEFTGRFGFEQAVYGFNPGNYFINGIQNTRLYEIDPGVTSHSVLYFGSENDWTEKISGYLGVRFNYWQNVGPATTYKFNDGIVTDTVFVPSDELFNIQTLLEPRLQLKYRVNSSSHVNLGYSRMSQFLQIISNSISPFTTLDVWLPSSSNIAAQFSDQVEAGYKKYFYKNVWKLEADVYYKIMHNQVEYENQPNLLANPLIEGELRFGKTKAAGLEIILSKTKGKFTGWTSYNYSRVIKQSKDINNGVAYPAGYDRPHEFNAHISFTTRKRTEYNVQWQYLSGGAISIPQSYYITQNHLVPIYGKKNDFRLPAYHRLDVSATFHLSKPDKKFQHELQLAIFNLYNRKNPVYANYSKIKNDNGEYVIPANYANVNNQLSTYTYVYGLIPSLSYKFSF